MEGDKGRDVLRASTEYPNGVSPKKKAIAAYLREPPSVTSKSMIARELQIYRTTVRRYYDDPGGVSTGCRSGIRKRQKMSLQILSRINKKEGYPLRKGGPFLCSNQKTVCGICVVGSEIKIMKLDFYNKKQ